MRLLIFAVLILGSSLEIRAYADSPIIIKHYQFHDRYAYGAQLLDLAMSKLNTPYQIVAPSAQIMNEARGERQVISGHFDLEWMSTTPEREAKMIAIKIPIYRWILGLRLLLVKQARYEELSRVSSIDQLRQYVAVHGKHWGDLSVYKANDLSVSAHVKYESLFEILIRGRVDYFHRGLNEIWGELERHEDELAIASNVMLFYPLPVYFFVTQSRPELAKQLQRGLEIALEDGSFEQHFLAYHQAFIDRAGLDKRALIKLINPDLPKGTPSIDASWWLSESQRALLSDTH